MADVTPDVPASDNPAAAARAAKAPNRMHVFDPQMAELFFDVVRERLSIPETPIDGLGDRRHLEEVVAGLITEEGRSAEDVLKLYVDHLADTVLSADSPRFHAFIPAAPTKASLLFDMLVSASSLQGCSWMEAAGAVIAENQALEVMADLVGLPKSARGVFVSGGSAGNLSALVVGRDAARRKRAEAGLPDGRLRVAVSDQAHSSIKNALNIVAMDAFVVQTEDGRLTGERLRAALADDEDPSDIVAVVATAGTTNAGIIDDLRGIGEVAREHGWWFHVDGAYGGAGLLAPSIRHLYDGIDQCDSIVMDPHKWWFAPFDVAALIYRDPHLARAVHTQDASYLDVIHEDETDFNPSDMAYHLTRRARGLSLWFSMAVNGISAYRDAVESTLRMTQYTAQRIVDDPLLELVRDPTLSVVLFRRQGWSHFDYIAWSNRLLQEQTAFVTHTLWRGETVGRLVFLHPSTTEAMIDEILESLH